MKIRQLINYWQNTGDDTSPKITQQISVSVYDAARLAALADLFPALKSEEIVAELLHAALNEVQEIFPYVKGQNKIGEDEQGNPIYEDEGYTPRFLALINQHLARLAP